MADKARVSLAIPKIVYSGQVFAINVEVTNTGRSPLTVRSVTPQIVPGALLPLQEKWEATELDELEQRKRALVAEMEHQLSVAYSELERDETRESRSRPKRIADFVFTLLGGLIVLRAVEVLATGISSPREEGPAWATQSARIEEWEDVVRAEKEVISELPDNSRIRKAFLIDKQKLERCLENIRARETSASADVNLERTVIIDPGDTSSFPFRCRARSTYRRETTDVGFQIKWSHEKGLKSGVCNGQSTVEIVPSSRIVATGAGLGAVAGVLVRWSFVQGPNGLTRGILQVVGGVALAVLVAAALARKPESLKPFAVEDFLGGVLIGGLAGIYSDEILEWLKNLLPEAGDSQR